MKEPSYLGLNRTGELAERIGKSLEILKSCTLCPRQCRVDRTVSDRGFCRSTRKARVASFSPHFGEEAVLVGHGGSGTIFS
jgi:putative pyruvate formate lyase activating enzyme